MLTTKENTVRIEGILSEIDLKYGSFNKKGVSVRSVTGTIKIRVNQVINGENKVLEVPVSMFAGETTNAGTKNPAFESAERVMNEFKSIAAVGEEEADRVRITSGQISNNEYYNQSGQLVSFPRIRASFVSKIKKDDCHDEATFSAVVMVAAAGMEMDKDGVETGRYRVRGVIPQWGGKVDVLDFYAMGEGVISAVSSYWSEGDTVKMNGKLNFSSKTETRMVPVDFGEPREEHRTISVSELVITGGSNTPLEGDFAFNPDEIQSALNERQAHLEEMKTQSKTKTGRAGKAPAESNANRFKDLGF